MCARIVLLESTNRKRVCLTASRAFLVSSETLMVQRSASHAELASFKKKRMQLVVTTVPRVGLQVALQTPNVFRVPLANTRPHRARTNALCASLVVTKKILRARPVW